MTLVKEELHRPGGGPSPGMATVRLVASTTDARSPGYSGDVTILGRWKERAVDGIVTFDLVPQSAIIPPGTVYEIVSEVPGTTSSPRYFTVLDVPEVQWVQDRLTDPPGALPSPPLAVETAARIAADEALDVDLAAEATIRETADNTQTLAIAARLTEAQGDARYQLAAVLIGIIDLDFDPATQGELDAAQLTATVRSYRPASIVYLGDSVTARGGQFDTGSRAGVGYTTWVQALSGERLTPLYNAGIAGELIGQIAARLQADVIARAPGVCVILAGINDIKGAPATSLATMQAIMTSMLDQLRAAGILAIVCTIPPSDLLNLATEKAQWHAWNRWLLSLGGSRSGLRVCNIAPHVTDPAATIWGAGLSDDGTHENAAGSLAMAAPLASVLSAIYPPLAVIGAGIGDVDEKMPNPNMTGNTAGAATGVAIIGGALTKVARTDGRLGEWQQWATAVSTAGTFLQDALVAASGLVPGDRVRGELEFETDPAWNGVTSFFVSVEDRSSANVVVASQVDFGPTPLPRPTSGVLRTNPLTLVNGFRVRLFLRIVTGAGSAAVIRIGRMSLRKV